METEHIVMRYQDEIVRIVTDGRVARSYTATRCRPHRSLTAAIAFYEAIGYSIMTDMFNQ